MSAAAPRPTSPPRRLLSRIVGNRLWKALAGTLLVGVILSTVGARQWEHDAEARERTALESLTALRTSYINAALLGYGELVSSLAAFEAQSGDDPVAFDQFVSSLHHEWHVGFDNAFVISRSPDGTASVRYGAPYPAPFPPEHDLLEDPDRRSAMQESIDLGLPVMGPVGLLQAQPARSRGHADVIEVYTPIFEPGPIPATAAAREAEAVGWVALTLDLEEALSRLGLPDSGLDLALEIRGTGTLIGESSPGAAERIAAADISEAVTIDMVSRQFTLSTTFAAGRNEPSTGTWIFLSGILITALFTYAVGITLRHRNHLERQAEGDRKHAELMSSRFYAAVDEAPVGVLVSDLSGEVEIFNDRLRRLVGAPPDVESSIWDYILPDDVEEIGESLRRISAGETDRVVSERQLRRHDGDLIWCRLSTSVLRDTAGEPTHVVAHVQDIAAERRAAEELRSRERWFSSIVEHAEDLIVLIDRESRIKWASPWVAHEFEVSSERLIGMSVLDFVHPDDRIIVAGALQQVTTGEPITVEYRLTKPSGDQVWMESTTSDLLSDPDVGAIITVSRDVTERRRSTQALAHRAAHDPLTGLFNRTEFELRMGEALHETATTERPVCLAFLDIDSFKAFNDEHGHEAGDEVLRSVARAIEAEVRHGDVVARIGGDEMVIGLIDADVPTSQRVIERIRERLREPVEVAAATATVEVTVSIGLAAAIPGESLPTLLHRADVALYEAKRLGRDRVAVYHDDLTHELVDHHDEVLLDLRPGD